MYRVIFALVVLALTATALPAEARNAEFGHGEAPRYDELYGAELRDILNDARAPAMAALGGDALRFSSQPALGGAGYIMVLRSSGDVQITWYYGHVALGWRRTRRVRFEIDDWEYEDVVADVDRMLAVG